MTRKEFKKICAILDMAGKTSIDVKEVEGLRYDLSHPIVTVDAVKYLLEQFMEDNGEPEETVPEMPQDPTR